MGTTRRELVAGGVTAWTASSARAIQGSNERIRVAFIGIGNRGSQLLEAALPNKDIEVAALCDAYKPYRDKWSARIPGAQVYTDFRKVLEDKTIDAAFVATPDHWHAIMTIDACDAGKDVYCEKPASLTVHEGRHMVEAARRNNRIVQVGLQRRSSPMFARIRQLVLDDKLGKVTVARAYRITNMFPKGVGVVEDAPPPPGLDWDMWLGPRPKRAFNANIAPYKFRWWKAYSSQLANWGVHYFDAIRWLVDERAPSSVCAMGGNFAVADARDIPDTMECTFEFATGRLLLFGQYEASGVDAMRSGELELRGTQGALYAGARGYEIVPERGGQFQDPAPRMAPVSIEVKEDLDSLHVRNFLDCVKSRRKPNCDIEEGHRSTTFAHLANISLATKQRLEWDMLKERFTNSSAANALLETTYREPWKLR